MEGPPNIASSRLIVEGKINGWKFMRVRAHVFYFLFDLRMTEPYARQTELIDRHAEVIKEIN